MNCAVCQQRIKWHEASVRIEGMRGSEVWALQAHERCRPNQSGPSSVQPRRVDPPELLEHMRPHLVHSLRSMSVSVSRAQPLSPESWRVLEAAADLLEQNGDAAASSPASTPAAEGA